MIARVIGITGYARHGKDTIASVLVKDLGYNRLGLADLVRQALLTLDPIIGRPLLPYVRLSEIVGQEGWNGAKQMPEVRRLMQVMGTQVGRELLGEYTWIHALELQRGFHHPERRIVIPDVRFENEAEWIRGLGGEIWKVTRPDFDNGVGISHPSEAEVLGIMPDHDAHFVNDLDEDYLKSQVRRYVKERMSFAVGMFA